MKKALLIAGSIALVSATTASFAGIVTGTVLAFDRQANIIVLTDKSIYNFQGQKGKIPEGLKAGDRIAIDSDGEGEDGYGDLEAVKILN